MQKRTTIATVSGAWLPSWALVRQRPASVLRVACDALLSIALAPSCAACDTLLEHPMAGPVCPECWQSIRPLTPPLCAQCADPLPTWRRADTAGSRCARCRRRPSAIECVRAVGTYDGALGAIIQALKYEGRRSLARPLAALMQTRGVEVLNGADCVVPVPLHRSRRRTRGFNQAADLARHLGLPVVHALRRIRATATQAELPSAQRYGNVRNAFAPTKNSQALTNCTIVLVDDVTTTGATLEACAKALKASGVREVRALTAARVVSTRHSGRHARDTSLPAAGGDSIKC